MIRRWSMFTNGLTRTHNGAWVAWQDASALLDALHAMVRQHCTDKDGTLDSMAETACADAMHILDEEGRIEITAECGRRVIARDR